MIIFFGEAPGPNTSPLEPLSPYYPNSTGERLQKLTGLSKQEYCDRFMRLNLIDRLDGPWPKEKAKEIAEVYLDASYAFNDRVTIVLLGRRVAHAFGLFEAPFFQLQIVNGFKIYVMPHPSGLNRWYNDEDNISQCERFIRNIMEEDERHTGIRAVYRPSLEPRA